VATWMARPRCVDETAGWSYDDGHNEHRRNAGLSDPAICGASEKPNPNGTINQMNTWRSLLPPHNKRAIVCHAFSITASAFVLNYLWENMQCSWFFIHRGGDTGQIAMVLATLGDVAMTWMAQGLVAAVSRRWLWLLEPWHWRQWATLFGAALVLSVLVESWGLATSRWAYTAINPRVPSTPISVLPVAQLLLLFPLTFGLSRKFMRLALNPSAIARANRTSP